MAVFLLIIGIRLLLSIAILASLSRRSGSLAINREMKVLHTPLGYDVLPPNDEKLDKENSRIKHASNFLIKYSLLKLLITSLTH